MSPDDRELQPVEPMLPLTKRMWESGTVIEALKLCREPRPEERAPFKQYLCETHDRVYHCSDCMDELLAGAEPCSPPASQPVAEPAEPSAPSQEGSATAGGAGRRCPKCRGPVEQYPDNSVFCRPCNLAGPPLAPGSAGSCCVEMAKVPPRLLLVSTHLWLMEAYDEFSLDILPFSWCPWCGEKLVEGEP